LPCSPTRRSSDLSSTFSSGTSTLIFSDIFLILRYLYLKNLLCPVTDLTGTAHSVSRYPYDMLSVCNKKHLIPVLSRDLLIDKPGLQLLAAPFFIHHQIVPALPRPRGKTTFYY